MLFGAVNVRCDIVIAREDLSQNEADWKDKKEIAIWDLPHSETDW